MTEKERIRNRVLQTCSLPQSPRPTVIRLLPKLAAATVALLAIALPAAYFLNQEQQRDSQFTVRGVSKSGDHGTLFLMCKGQKGNKSGEALCRPGDTLLFRATASGNFSHFSAVSVGPGNRVVWYFPGSGTPNSVSLLQQPAPGVIPRGITVGPEHKNGSYAVYGLLSFEPLTKQRIRKLIEGRRQKKPDNVLIMKQRLTVEAKP